MRRIALILALILIIPKVSNADNTTPQPFSITSLLSSLSLDIGTGYDIKNKQWTETDTVRFLEYANTTNTGKYSSLFNFIGQADPALSVGYSTADKFVVGAAFNLVTPSMFNISSPLLKYFAIRPFADYSFYHITDNVTNIKNSWIFGATIIKAQG